MPSIQKNTIAVSTITRGSPQGKRHLEQITTEEVSKRGLMPTGVPLLFERERVYRHNIGSPFIILDSDFDMSRQGRTALVVPEDAIAYVAGGDSYGTYFTRHENDQPLAQHPFIYIPVQFYKIDND